MQRCPLCFEGGRPLGSKVGHPCCHRRSGALIHFVVAPVATSSSKPNNETVLGDDIQAAARLQSRNFGTEFLLTLASVTAG